jgi:voltage-gated potassium channel Kch
MTPPVQPSPIQARNAAPGRPGRALARSGLFRFSVARFLAALVLLFVTAPFIEALPNGEWLDTVLATVVMCMGVVAVGARRRTLIVAIVLVLPAVVGKWVNHLWPGSFPLEAGYAARLVFLAFLVACLLVFILRAPRVNSEVLCAGISVYLLIGLLWALAYEMVAQHDPSAFAFSVPPASPHVMARFNAFYFSFMTLTTVGYGDITPVSNVARMLAIMESMSGTLFVGVLIARLVSLYSAPGPVEAADNQPNPLATAPGTSQIQTTQEESAQDGQRL